MTVWDIFILFGGLTIFLFGMMEMNKHLTSIASGKMKSIMTTLTRGKVRGYLTGLGITIVNQSSSATTVLEAALVGAGLLTFQQSLAVTLGAELGSTFLPQIVAFPSVSKFSTLIIAMGFLYSILAKTKKQKHIGMTLFMFGLLFLGMSMMSQSLKPLRTYEPFINLMKNVETPILGILMGLVFTMIIQSSGATTGITIAMAIAGTISLEQAIPINLGAAVGTCITAVLGSITLNWEAKRTAYVHILFQLIGIVWIYILLIIPFHGERLYIWGIKWFCSNVLKTDSLARQIAMGFTFMPLINHIIIFPNLKLIVRFFDRLFPPKEIDKPFSVKYVSDKLLESNSELALLMAKREILRVAKYVQKMMGETKTAFRSSDTAIIESVREKDSRVDILHKTIIPFLARLSQQELKKKESEKCMNYMYIENELESIGDVIDKNIMVLAEKKIVQNLIFSEEGFHELDSLILVLNKNLMRLIIALDNEDPVGANNLLENYCQVDEEKYKQLHIERLHNGLVESIATSSVHLDLISYYSRINSHISYIAGKLLEIH
jgi:phosphate:Na+ symporter